MKKEQSPEKKLKTAKFKKAQQRRQDILDQKKRKQSKNKTLNND